MLHGNDARPVFQSINNMQQSTSNLQLYEPISKTNAQTNVIQLHEKATVDKMKNTKKKIHLNSITTHLWKIMKLNYDNIHN